ncbi:MAG TPA: thiopurine S-methyltransferase [Steroidobacteraceae bacterium]|nr:thiopurine S-methyltransferase [Steroidobacteraceae bacterium]
MEPEFWLDRWQRHEIGFHQAQINADLQAYWPSVGCAPTAPVLVPLCGKSTDMCWLHARGHPILGVELSALAVQEFYAEQQLVPRRHPAGALECWEADGYRILVGDIFDLDAAALAGIAGVYDRAALIALPPPVRARYARHLTRILPEGCPILLVTMDYPQELMSGPPFSVPGSEVRTLFAPAFTITVLAARDHAVSEPHLQQRGLQNRRECVFLLQR